MRRRMSKKFSRSISIASGVLVLLLGAPSIASATPPSNDALASPTVISSIPFTETLSTEEATSEQPFEPNNDCSYQMGRTVWYEFTPQSPAVISVDTDGSDFDAVVAVWTGGASAPMSHVACDDGDYGEGPPAAHFLASPGTQYLIQVGGDEGASGNLTVSVDVSAQGSISGTVTSSAGGPLSKVCVWLWTGETIDIEQGMRTNAAGAYFFGGVADGAYKVEFYECDARLDHRSEWWENRESWYVADQVVVSDGAHVTGIDGELEKVPGPELYVEAYGPGVITSEPAGIDCGFDCKEIYEWDSMVTLTATPNEGARLLEWTNCDRVQGNQCQLDMYNPRFAYAQFMEDDLDPPNTTITTGPDRFTSSRSGRFTLQADEWPHEFECSLDGGGFDPCGSPTEFDGLADGTHELRVRALDESGNADTTPAEWRWTVDTTLPELGVERPKAGLYVNNMPVGETGPTVVVGMVSVEIRATDAESGVSSFRFEVNGSQIDPSQVTVDGDLYRFAFRPTTPGTYDIRGRATNGAGDSRSVSFQVIGAPA